MIDHVVVDVEIQNCVDDKTYSWNDTDKLGVACAVLYEFRTDRFTIYGPSDVEALRSRLLAADRISGFNTWKFDFPVIWALPGRQRVEALKEKSNDILRRIWIALGADPDSWSSLHAGWSLNAVIKGTLHKDAAKIGYGGDAPKWYQAGQIARLHSYCLDDVRLERDLAVFIDNHGYVVNGDSGRQLWL
jgi:DEAD/DEAH box helicase domain-containing protein